MYVRGLISSRIYVSKINTYITDINPEELRTQNWAGSFPISEVHMHTIKVINIF